MPSNEDKYRLIQKQHRKKFLLLQKQLEKEYADISSKLMGKIQKLAFDFADKDGLFKKSDMDQINLEVSSINYWFANEMKDWLDNNITKSADIAIQGQDNAAEYFVKSLIQESAGQDKALLAKALSDGGSGILLRTRYGTGLAKSIRDAVWKKRWDDGFKLSDRVWKMNQLMNDNVKHMVEDCVNQGKSAVNFAKAVEQYLEKPGPAWTTGIKPSITGRGSVKFNALRIARTETNQAYQKAQNLSDKNSVIVKGTKWNLSSSHPTVWPPSSAYNGYPEICDYRAKHNHHGLGPGVFPPGKAPSDHPNGLCYLTSELYQGEELVNRIKEKYNIKEKQGKLISDSQMKRDKKQHKKYKEILGDNAPGTFEKFQDLKYNKIGEWKSLQGDYQKLTAYNKIIKNEPKITKDLQAISKETGVKMVGLEYRLKSKESYLRKINTKSKHSLDPKVINYTISKTTDVIRYTYQDTVNNLINSYQKVVDKLAAKGYAQVTVNNTWINKRNPYKGVNTVYRAKNNQAFEVQFHTPESFKLKKGELHKLYEEYRLDSTTSKRKSKITREMFRLSSKLTTPKDIDKIKERS